MFFYERLKRIFFCFTFLCIHQQLLGQAYTFRHYQVESGLSYNSVICSLQDINGFMWFGTKNGLNRFDGYRFKIYRNDPAKPESLGHNFIHSLFEDNQGLLWVGTRKGLYRYNPIKDTFILINETRDKDISTISADVKGRIWFIANNTLLRYDIRTKKINDFPGPQYGGATSLAITKEGDIWVSTAQGYLQQYGLTTNEHKVYSTFEDTSSPLSKWIEKIKDTGDGHLIIGTSNDGVKLFSTIDHRTRQLPMRNTDGTNVFARDFLQRTAEEYWIATESGIFIYNMRTQKYVQLRNKINDFYSISDNAVYTITRDKEGGIWCGTYFGGLSYYPQQYTSFDKFYPGVADNRLKGYAVREIQQDKNEKLWIGTEDSGLNRFDPKTGNFKNFIPQDDGQGISHSNIHGLAAKGNKLWIGTFEQGLDVMDINTGRIIKKYKAGPAPNQFKSNFIESLLVDSNGELLVGTATGLYKYRDGSDDFILLNEFPGNRHYSALLESSEGILWAGTLRDGLWFFDKKNNQSGNFSFNAQDKSSLSSNEINGLFEDSMHNLWITTEDGLCILKKGARTFKRYTTADGFPSNIFYKILEDKNRNLWISTSRGLVLFNQKNGKIITYTKSSGLLGDQFNYSSAFKDATGQMYFGSVKGMIAFRPEHFRENRVVSKIFITGFQVDNVELMVGERDSPLSSPIDFTKEVKLRHDQSNFSIDFAALGFTSPAMTEYAFMMKGLDDKWTYLKTNRKVYFTSLSPGKYEFLVKASNNGRIWGKQIRSLKIIIAPPLWASPTALAIYGLMIAAIVIVLVKNNHKRILLRYQRKIERWEVQNEKELYHAKINFFTQVTHEIRTPLSLIHGPLEEVIRITGRSAEISSNLQIMKQNTHRLIELCNQLLDFRKTEQEGFNLSFVSLDVNELLKQTCTRFQPIINEKKITLNLELDNDGLVVYADAEALNKIISNLLDNALKYASTAVWIKISSDQDTFNIQFINDGTPIPEKYREKIFEPFYRMEDVKGIRGSGIGLSLARSLAELHDGNLSLVLQDDDYTHFELRLPKRHNQEYTLAYNNGNYQETSGAEVKKLDPDAPNVLVVEDNPDLRRFIVGILKEDFTVIAVENGSRAMDILQQTSVQLIVSDIIMPLMDGLELCKTLKDSIDYAHIPVILLTAKNSLQTKIEGLEAGADAYIEKPFSPNHLLTQISNLLNVREKIKTHFAQSPLVHLKSMAYNKADEAFLDKLNDTIVKNMSDTTLDVDFLAEAMNMSRPTLYRKTKAISNLSPHELINITRLKHAALLLNEGQFKILKIASITGFSSQTQFSRSFAKQFKMTPSEYVNSSKLTKSE
ncbi:hybrid sensor histidine kinase/response regulator [Pedobacter chinensis]|uniref:histidine kinase n=1 Tax=Pedobacter chinensis TaxID=2282421 RepID=A0A369Q0E9_9SPHI|nr:two-component regulator propeller domain-containing protein [Pedobacter chinensis]RDC55808.1 hybrid sensor histidine kinase/response regulator [Pedobacter chinensis]